MTAEENLKITQLENEVRRLRSAVEELTVLNDLAIAASTSLEVDQMLDIIVQKSIKAVKAEQGSILLVTEQQEAPLKTLIRQVDQQRSRIMNYKVGINITGWVLQHQQPLLIENLATDTRFQTTEQERKEIKNLLCVPIRFKAQLIGLLTVTNKRAFEPFNAEDLRLLSIIAAQSGQLIRNSQLQAEALEKKRMEQELLVARKIQTSLLPKKPPASERLEVSAYFNPADEVGGDYYDYFALGDEQFGVVMADVSGHGTSAALVMAMVKGVLQSIAQRFESPDRLLAEVNAILSRIAPKEMFVTMIFLVFDMKNKLLRYSNAGHNPLLFYDHQAQTCQMVELRGPALGLSALAAFQERQIALNAGDIFLIYTDGVTEAFNMAGKMFEEARLVQAVQATVSEPASNIIAHVKTKLQEFRGSAIQGDDVAMIAVKIH
ncbi:MAG: SpoIIE family protein phosphatase [candidate division KSB1 bacterium]|nr:SpoIIE family protein phosphatase [candidate division KSB1 bacterium]MDZ7303649.1 SpoIIE family protein phosphatase [candidate division KSB1 bacterium]MDZ7313331.1 SpoIIE family protein phosphatase [candidate division KSB1 bacterium]